mgnify:CR=1 FL=1
MSKQVLRNLSMMLGLTFCLLAGMLGLQSKAGHAAPDDWGSIGGAVRGPGGGVVKNIVVVLQKASYPSGWRQAGLVQTDDAGHYAFVQLGPGSYRVRFLDLTGGYAVQYYAQAVTAETATSLTVNGNQLGNVDAQLVAAGSIEGSILGAVATAGTVGAYVLVGDQWQLVNHGYVDGDMHYKIDSLPPGTYHVCAVDGDWYAGYSPCYDHIGGGVAWGTDVAVASGSSVKGIDITKHGLQDAATIDGTVTDKSGVPLCGIRASAMVFISGGGSELSEVAAAESDEAGVYRLGDLPAGDYVVQFRDTGGPYIRQYFKGTRDVSKASLVTLGRFEQRSGVSDHLALGGTITGTLTFAGQYPPVTATVTAVGNFVGPDNWFDGSYDPGSGEYTIRRLPAGQYMVTAAARDPLGNERVYWEFYRGGSNLGEPTAITVTGGSTIGGIDIQLAQDDYAAIISGTVSSESSQRLAGIRVDLLKAANSAERAIVYTTTDALGSYQFEGIPTGAYFLRFSDPAGVYAPTYAFDARRPVEANMITVELKQSAGPINARLLRSGSIHGQVRSAAGKRYKGMTVWFMLDTNVVAAVKTDATGSYDSGPLPPGSYQVCAQGPVNNVFEYSCLGYEYGAPWPGLQVPLQAEETVQQDLVFGYVPQFAYKQYLPDVAAQPAWP